MARVLLRRVGFSSPDVTGRCAFLNGGRTYDRCISSTSSLASNTRVTQRDEHEAIRQAKPFSDFLTDSFGRQHDYLRISLTERCNLRCLYCMPEDGIQLSPPRNILTSAEIYRLSTLFVHQGVTKIRLTGGEPTVKKDIVPLMRQLGGLRRLGLRDLAMTTNGISLHRKLDDMVAAGLTGVNISLDTLDPFQFQLLTRRQGFQAVMKSIDKVKEMNRNGAGIKLKVNCVVMRGLNDHQIIPFTEMTEHDDMEVRFIEYMPFGGNKWSQNKMMSYSDIVDEIRKKYPGIRRMKDAKNDTSKTWQIPGFVGRVGFITSMTHNFCSSCNRLRITSDGNIKVCLHGQDEVSLRDILRKCNGGEPLEESDFEVVQQALSDPALPTSDKMKTWIDTEHELLEVIGTAVKVNCKKPTRSPSSSSSKRANQLSACSSFPHSHRSGPPSHILRRHRSLDVKYTLRPRVGHYVSPTSIFVGSHSENTDCGSVVTQNVAEGMRSLSPSSLWSLPLLARRRSSRVANFTPNRTSMQNRLLMMGGRPGYTHDDSIISPTLQGRTNSKSIHMMRRHSVERPCVLNNDRAVLDASTIASQLSERPHNMRTSISTKHGIPASERTVRHGPDNLELTHVNTAGEAHMVDVGYKSATRRVAIAQGSVRFSNPQPLDLVSANSNKKGDVLGVARIAALMAAKRTSDLIPLCHPVSISKAEVDITMVSSTGGGFNTVGGHGCAAIEARVDCVGVTGIEMEALTAVAVAALTIYDMCKAVDKRMVIEQARLVYKSGGKSGVFVEEEWYAKKGRRYLDGGAGAQQ